jgi:hypothetical protein
VRGRRTAAGCVIALLALASVAIAVSPASNRARGRTEAARLLRLIELPPGAVASASDPAGNHLSQPGLDELTPNLLDAHAWWTVPGNSATILAYVAAHLPAGAKLSSTGGSSGPNTVPVVADTFALAPIRGVLSQRILAVTVVQLTSTTAAVRTDGETVWITPRPAWERIPAGVRSVSITASGPVNRGLQGPVSAPQVITGARARRLVTFINDLEVVQPGVIACPALMAGSVNLGFVGAGGNVLARAVEVPSGCALVGLTIGRRIGDDLNDYPSVSGELERLGAFPLCSASQLEPSASLPARSVVLPPGAGTRELSFTFRNRSDAVCRLSGFPRLALFDARGRAVHVAVTDLGAALVRREGMGAAALLDPQQSAVFGVNWSLCAAPHAVRARIALPGVARRFVLPVGSGQRPFAPCGGRLSVGNLS